MAGRTLLPDTPTHSKATTWATSAFQKLGRCPAVKKRSRTKNELGHHLKCSNDMTCERTRRHASRHPPQCVLGSTRLTASTISSTPFSIDLQGGHRYTAGVVLKKSHEKPVSSLPKPSTGAPWAAGSCGRVRLERQSSTLSPRPSIERRQLAFSVEKHYITARSKLHERRQLSETSPPHGTASTLSWNRGKPTAGSQPHSADAKTSEVDTDRLLQVSQQWFTGSTRIARKLIAITSCSSPWATALRPKVRASMPATLLARRETRSI